MPPLSSALAAACEETNQTSAPSIEEILNEYHQKSFQEQATGISLCSNGKTLEEETVEALNNAGYEAYHVTGDNYDELEVQLQTDFSFMGMNDESSYIVTLSAIGNLPEHDFIQDGGGSGYFYYTYEGVQYKMRNLYVTAATDAALAQTSSVTINDLESAEMLDIVLSFVAGKMGLGIIWTFLDILEAKLPDGVETTFSNIVYTAGSNWNVMYTQIYDNDSSSWITCGSSEYVLLRHWIDYVYYDSASNVYDRYSIEGDITTVYSEMYQTSSERNATAVRYYLLGRGYAADDVKSIEYLFDGEVVITHQRN